MIATQHIQINNLKPLKRFPQNQYRTTLFYLFRLKKLVRVNVNAVK